LQFQLQAQLLKLMLKLDISLLQQRKLSNCVEGG
jgi:hypothetical protein